MIIINVYPIVHIPSREDTHVLWVRERIKNKLELELEPHLGYSLSLLGCLVKPNVNRIGLHLVSLRTRRTSECAPNYPITVALESDRIDFESILTPVSPSRINFFSRKGVVKGDVREGEGERWASGLYRYICIHID